MNAREEQFHYALRMADTTMVIAQRHCELLGHGPVLEEEIAQSNIGLDLLGQATAWYELAADIGGKGKSADDLVYFRNEREYTNYLLVEQENTDFAHVVLRGYLLSSFLLELYNAMSESDNEAFAAIAKKSIKEVTYHCEHLSEWLFRLGGGTEESHQRLANALDDLWPYTEEMFEQDKVEQTLTEANIVPDKTRIKERWLTQVESVLQQAEMRIPQCEYFHRGGIEGYHGETLGFLLAEMQSLVRAYPGAKW